MRGDRSILEVATGTGYWTEFAATVAKAITATDYNPETLAVAVKRKLGSHVAMRVADAYELPEFTSTYRRRHGAHVVVPCE